MATIESLLAENHVLQTQLTQLKTALHDAQNHIFSLQPHIQTLPNADAITLFRSLVSSVENWVDKYLADSLEEGEVAADALDIQNIRNLMNLIPTEGKAAFNIAYTDVDIIQAAILRFLVESIFNQEFCTPLPRPEMEFVMEVERAMRVLKPKRGTFLPPLFLSSSSSSPYSWSDINRLMSRCQDNPPLAHRNVHGCLSPPRL
jgi:hypothetical protein